MVYKQGGRVQKFGKLVYVDCEQPHCHLSYNMLLPLKNCQLKIVQALYFFMGIGAFIAPLIVEPFLVRQDCSLYVEIREKNVSLPLVGALPQCRAPSP